MREERGKKKTWKNKYHKSRDEGVNRRTTRIAASWEKLRDSRRNANSSEIHARSVKQPRGAIDGFPVEIFAQFILLNKLGTMDVYRGAKKRNTTDAWQSSEKGEGEEGLGDP